MCFSSSPKVQAAPAAPVTDTYDEGTNREAARQSDLRRRRRQLSRQQTMRDSGEQGQTLGG